MTRQQLTACFVFPEASGHINSSLALAARLCRGGWTVHYLSAEVMRECITCTGSTFSDETLVAKHLCRDGLSYFEAYERLRKEELGPNSKAWEARAHLENKFLLQKLPGTIKWIQSKSPDVVVYCPLWNRVAQIASVYLKIPHVGIITIAGFGGFGKILNEFMEPEGATIEDLKDLYLKSPINLSAIDEMCAEPYCLPRELFMKGCPIYYWGDDPPFANTVGKHALVTTIPSLRDPFLETLEAEDQMYAQAGCKMHYIGPMVGESGLLRASTHKAAWTEEERRLLIDFNNQVHRRRSMLRPTSVADDKLLDIVKNAKSLGRRVCLVTLGTVVTSDRAAFGWRGHGLGESITGKELVQSVINGVIDALGLDLSDIDSSVNADETDSPLLILTVGQQPDALDGISLPANALARASVPQIEILRLMTSNDLFIHHGGQNSTMEGSYCGIPCIVCPTFSDQPVNAAKLVALGVGLKVDRPTKSGPEAVNGYRQQIAHAIAAIILDGKTFSEAAVKLKEEIAESGGEESAEQILLQAINEGV